MTNASWKAYELRIAKLFKGRRRGANTTIVSENGKRLGQNDIIAPGWSIECKLFKTPALGVLRKDLKKAVWRREQTSDIPLAILKRKSQGVPDGHSVVGMREQDFLDFFGKGFHAVTLTGSRIPFSLLETKLLEAYYEADKLMPVVIVKQKDKDTIYCMRLFEFLEYHVA